jgi:predicted RNase H-like nuclease
LKDLDTGTISWHLFASAKDLILGGSPNRITAIDVPIGLPDRGPRLCDREARKLLGPGRASSVFPAPIRPVLAASSYEEACEIRSQIEDKKMSLQSWAIVPKIREVDEVLREDVTLQSKVREVHPEVSFYFLAGKQPMKHSKKRRAGKEERRSVLEPVFGHWLAAALAERKSLGSAQDDILDAFVALWTAERVALGTFHTIPPTPPRDSCGLRMEIVA